MGCSKRSSNREIYSNKHLHQEKRKLSNKQSNFTIQRARIEEQSPKIVEGRKTKIRVEINEIETK